MSTSADPPSDSQSDDVADLQRYQEVRIHRQLIRFLMVGLTGFGLDVLVMAILVYGAGFGEDKVSLISSRIVAWAAAILLTYFLNARFTFGASIRHSRFFNYLFIQGIGAGINLGTFSVLVLFGPFSKSPLIAMIIGSALATINNFLLVRVFVYRFPPEIENPV